LLNKGRGKVGFQRNSIMFEIRRNLTWWIKANFSKQLVSSVLII